MKWQCVFTHLCTVISELRIKKNYHLENIYSIISRVPGRGSLEDCTFRDFSQHIPFLVYPFLLNKIAGRDGVKIQNGLRERAIKMMSGLDL